MDTKWKLNSIVGRSGLYGFISFGAAMTIMVLLVLWITERQIVTLVETEDKDHVQTVVRMFDQRFKDYLEDLNQKAGAATLVNAVMDPWNTSYFLPDYMKNLSLRNISGSFFLLTFDGMIISSTDDYYKIGNTFPYFPELLGITEQNKFIQLQDKGKKVMFISEIKYNNLIEGFLVYISSFSNIFESNKYLFASYEQERYFSIIYQDTLLIETSKSGESFISTVFPMETLPLNMKVETNYTYISKPIKQIRHQIMLFSSLSALVLTIVFSILASKGMTRPLISLEKCIKETRFGNWNSIKIDKRDPIEFQFLRKAFNSMQLSLREKTEELEDSNSKLTKTNVNLKNTQKQLVHSEKMASIGQLAAGVAHEINNPTGFVSTNLHTMTEYLLVYKNLFYQMDELIACFENGEAAEKISTILKEVNLIKEEEDFPFILEDAFQLLNESSDGANRIKKIVQDLRKFARPDSMDFQSANINTAIEDALRLTSNELKYKCEVVKELGDLPEISCRIDQLTQVFVNLLVNAVHSITDHGIISIKSDLESNFILITVCDTGIGISKENITKLFDPFFTTKDVGMGTGLGLAISYGIIEKHDGQIEVESTPGKGTCFIIRLPQNRSIL
jgi:two-component system, NtrC family, sensor kinase